MSPAPLTPPSAPADPTDWADSPLSALDWALADVLQACQPSVQAHHRLLVVLTSHQFSRGHACLDLAQLHAVGVRVLGWDAHWQPLLRRQLPATDWAAWVQDLPWIQGELSPLVLQGPRLYLRRCAQAEATIRSSLLARVAQQAPADAAEPVWVLPPPAHIRGLLQPLFAPKTEVATVNSESVEGQKDPQVSNISPAPDWQQVACVLALRARVTLITGGPGTGKTTTVVRLLALLQACAPRRLRLALAAPTGKAAARLGAAIAQALPRLAPLNDSAPHKPDGSAAPDAPNGLLDVAPAQTLHRLLRLRGAGQSPAQAIVAADVVVVDEASMIDLELMARLMLAVPPGARLILLGDKDQLASVEAGAVMAQLCASAEAGGYDADTVRWVRGCCGQDISAWAAAPDAPAAGPLAQQTVMLRHSYRFAHDGGIGQWAQRVNQGDVAAVLRAWEATPPWSAGAAASGVTRNVGQGAAWAALLRAGWTKAQQLLARLQPGQPCDDATALAVLQALGQFQVLCALREGPWGVVQQNRVIARALGLPEQGWCVGRMVMVTRNDASLDLMNGDVGVALPTERGLRVAFGQGQGVRWVLPSRLDAVEPAWAMTVHKSQGSEFAHVALMLPDRWAPVLTRELLYTGITRASERLTLIAPDAQVLQQAVAQRLLRSGGLGVWAVPEIS
ncbi:MAG: exodeoxyribonuclease V subunit alpha [Rhodoferax sp.]